MACMIQFAPAMATNQLARVAHYEDAVVSQELPSITVRGPVRMNRVAVTDSGGNRVLRMQWKPSADVSRRFSHMLVP
jgi:hypothetical protein